MTKAALRKRVGSARYITAVHAINPLRFPRQPHDTLEDFAPVATPVSTQYILLLNVSAHANNLQECIAPAESKPGQRNGAGSNTGGIQHPALELFNAISVVPHVRSGTIKAIGIGGEARSPALPHMPTFGEAGLPGFNAQIGFGVVGPAHTPNAIVRKLADEIARIQAMADVRDRLGKQGALPFIFGPEAFAAFIKAEMARYARIIQSAKIKIAQ